MPQSESKPHKNVQCRNTVIYILEEKRVCNRRKEGEKGRERGRGYIQARTFFIRNINIEEEVLSI